MNRFSLIALALCVIPSGVIAEDLRPPIIDMHLHTIPVDYQGPPPQTVCAPYSAFPVWDPGTDYPRTFSTWGDQPGCGNPLVSPSTDDDLMRRSLEVLEELNVIGVTSGPPALVERWQRAAPDRIVPGLLFQLGDEAPSPADIEKLHSEGRLAVFGEVAIQYQGIEPDDPRFEAYLAKVEFHRYLRRIVEAGFGNRVMFGSDQMIWPEATITAVASIESVDFLSEAQKRDIFYNNAARFLRFSRAQVSTHHGGR